MNSAKKRATILLVLGAVIGAVAVGVYFLQNDRTPPTTDTPPTATSTPSIFDMEPIIPEAKVSTEGWKTCRNEEYGWEVRYPVDWYVYGEGHHSGVEGSTWGGYYANETECVGESVLLAEWVPGTQFVETLEGASVALRLMRLNQDTFPKAYLTISDVRTLVRMYYKSLTPQVFFHGVTEFAWLEDKNRVVVLGYHGTDLLEISTSQKSRFILETMLSTFRFLDTATSTTVVK